MRHRMLIVACCLLIPVLFLTACGHTVTERNVCNLPPLPIDNSEKALADYLISVESLRE